MRSTGFSATIGSWKIMPISLPRTAVSAFFGKARKLLPAVADAAPAMRPGRWISPMRDLQVMLLPLPLSPTRPNTSPSRMEKLTLSTALSACLPE